MIALALSALCAARRYLRVVDGALVHVEGLLVERLLEDEGFLSPESWIHQGDVDA
jgi:hypothetical protein